VARKWVQSWNAERAGPKEVRRVAKDKLLAELKGVI
jgi:hypothetical protein